MKKIIPGLFCIAFCLAVAFMMPNIGITNPNVDSTGCIADGCHSADTQHTGHAGQECGTCHAGGTGEAGDVAASSCAAAECHVGECEIVNAHDPARNATCLGCHPGCAAGDDDDDDTGDDDDDDTGDDDDDDDDTQPCPLAQIYGEDSAEAEALRDLRDDVLSKSPMGQAMINAYYKAAPAISAALDRNPALKAAIKANLDAILEVL